MIDHLLFDTTDFDTIDDTHSVGAYVRSGESGALISHHAYPDAGSVTFDFVDGDVTVGTDTIAETAHGLVTGDVVQLTTTGTLPTGLATATDYYVIRVDADNFQLAASAQDAERGIPVDITAAAGGGTHTVTEQEIDRRALDVYMVNPIAVEITQDDEITVFQGTDPWIIGDGGGSITVDAVDLDIRDLTHVSDSVSIGDGTDLLAINADGSINITDNGGSLTVDGTVSIYGDVNVTQGTSPWVIGDGGGSITVDATDLDIRDLTHVSDSVSLGDGTTLYTGTTVGSDHGLDVYQLNDPSVADTAIAHAANPLDTGDTAEDVVASPLANRKTLWIYNNNNKKMYIGATGVTQASGFPISPGSYLEMRIGPSVDIEWVAADAGHEIRTLEVS